MEILKSKMEILKSKYVAIDEMGYERFYEDEKKLIKECEEYENKSGWKIIRIFKLNDLEEMTILPINTSRLVSLNNSKK